MIKDTFGRTHDYLRISLTDKCNFRCTYCMPNNIKFMPNERLMTADEIIEIAASFVKMGVNKIRLTGGEPLIRKDFGKIIMSLADLNVKLAMTTNGCLLDEKLEVLKKANLNALNISLDTLKADRFHSLTQRNQFKKTFDNINLAIDEGFDVKMNMVVIKGQNDDEVLDFVQWSKDEAVDVRFIEFMPFQKNKWDFSKTASMESLLENIKTEFDYVPLKASKNDTAKNFSVIGGKGSFGFISTVTAPFCGGCNRIRLTADGKLKNCLFAINELDLKTALREGKNIEPLIQNYFYKKKASLGGFKNFSHPDTKKDLQQNRTMTAIGG